MCVCVCVCVCVYKDNRCVFKFQVISCGVNMRVKCEIALIRTKSAGKIFKNQMTVFYVTMLSKVGEAFLFYSIKNI